MAVGMSRHYGSLAFRSVSRVYGGSHMLNRNGAVSVSYNSPGSLAERHHLEGALRAPLDAVESIVDALLGA